MEKNLEDYREERKRGKETRRQADVKEVCPRLHMC